MIDLSDANAVLDQADRDIAHLSADVEIFYGINPYTLTMEHRADGWTNIYISAAHSLKNKFGPRIAAVIQHQRNSLDYTVEALALSNGAPTSTRRSFPITKTEEALYNNSSKEKIRNILPEHQKIIYGLRPFKGGNDILFALHTLNNEQKHRKVGLLGENVSP
jgi:hypothetical protein